MQITTTTIPARRIADLMTSAIEGGSGYWCKEINLIAPEISRISGKGNWYYDLPKLYEDPDLKIEVIELEPSSDKNKSGKWTIGIKEIENGFKLMQTFGKPVGYCWYDFIGEDEDANTADVFLQLCVFGETVYG